ncbi:TIGR04338 family metallohydrolase [Nocardioides montaniterrae]
MTSDPDKSAVYAAEDQLATWLDRVTPERPTISVDGAVHEAEVEPRFTDPEAVGRYVEQVLTHLRDRGCDYAGREQARVGVRARQGRTKAIYTPEPPTIAVPPFEVGGRWALRGLVVLHELTHHLSGALDHGADFRTTYLRLLEDIGNPVLAQLLHLTYAAQGLDQVDDDADEGNLAKIAKLLRQAEGTANDHERDAFLTKAQALATRHSIALAVARAHTARQEQREQPGSENYRIGEPGKRGLARYVRLLLNIAHTNDLRCTISHDSTAVTMYGFPSDIEVTKALYESLLVQMVAECERYLRSGERDVTVTRERRTRRKVVKPVATITARLAFYEAYAARIGHRLQQAREATLAAAGVSTGSTTGAGSTTGSSETALALRQKEVDVHDHFREALRKNNIRGTWSADRRSSAQSAPGAAFHGDAAAQRARLSDAKELGAAG